MSSDSGVGRAIAAAIRGLRARLGDDAAHVAVVVPSRVNGTLARRELALAMPHVRVTFVTPQELFSELAAGGLAAGGSAAAGLRREPPGWLRATLAGLVRTAALPEAYARVLAERGWLGALTSAIATLESAGVSAEAVGGLEPGGDLALRGRALAVLLEGVRAAREAERIAGPAELARLAHQAIAGDALVPANEPRAAVLLGDVHGTRLAFEVLRDWLAKREVVRLAPGAFGALEAAPLGITEAAPQAETIAIEIAPSSTSLVRTLDSVREADEAVREVWRHVRAGVALDRIALVLPDASACGAVRDALARAGIPATFQVGPPLAETEAARFARLVLRIAIDEGHAQAGVAGLYELLAMSSLRIRKVLGADATQGRGSWRGILSRCGAYRGLAIIARAVERRAAEVAADSAVEETERARRARNHATLLGAIEAVGALVAPLRSEQRTGEHARALHDVVATWWPSTPDQRALLALLETWGRSSVGPRVSLESFVEAIEEALDGTPFLTGSLREATVRVLSPMQLVGASFDAVIATGLVEGRLPVRPGEDPLLSDALIDALERATGAGLLRSDARIGIERRRFASIRSAAAGALWISVPASDPENGRPLLPGALLLEMLREREPGAGYDALERALVPVGHVATRWPEDPADALGAGEHLLARLHGSDGSRADRARSALVDHDVARRSLAKLRGEDRVARGERTRALTRWAGRVDPAVLPCPGLDGTTISLEHLRGLLERPEDHLRRTMLRAFRPPRLDESWDPVSWFFARRLMLDAAQAVLTRGRGALGGGGLASALRAELDARRDESLDRAGVDQAEVRDRLRRMSDVMLRALVRAEPVGGPVVTVTDAAIAEDLPWRVEGGRGRRTGAGLEWVVERTAHKTKIDDQTGALIEAAAHGSDVAVLRVIDLFGRSVPDDGSGVEEVLEKVRGATSLARNGFYPSDREGGIAELETWAPALEEVGS